MKPKIRFTFDHCKLPLVIFFTSQVAMVTSHAAIRYWDGDTNVTWADAANWDTPPANNINDDIAQFNSATYAFQPNAGTTSINGLIMGASSGAVTISGTTLSIGGSGIDMSAATANLTINAGTTLGAGQTFNVASGRTLTFGSTITNSGNHSLLLSGAGTISRTGGGSVQMLSGAGAVTLSNGTTVSFSGTNGSQLGTGSLTINGGTLNAGNNDFGLSNSSYLANADFSITGGGSGKVFNINTGAWTLGANVAVTMSASGIARFAGAIDDGVNAYSFTKLGNSGLVLSGAQTYDGNTIVNGGTLHIGGTINSGGINAQTATGSLSTSSAIVLTSGTLQFNRSNDVTQGTDFFGSAITGAAGGITQRGTAGTTLTLNAANTYGGATTATSGILKLSNALAIQNSTLTNSGGTVTFDSAAGTAFTVGGLSGSSALTLANSAASPIALTLNGNTASYSGALTGAAGSSILKTGSGTQTLTGSAALTAFAGATSINGGTLSFTGTTYGYSGSSTLSVDTGGSLTLTNNSGVSLSGAPVTLNGGTLNLRFGNSNDQTFNNLNGSAIGVSTTSTLNVNNSSSGSRHIFNLGPLSLGAATLNVTGDNINNVVFGATALTGNAVINNTLGSSQSSTGLVTLGDISGATNTLELQTTRTIVLGGSTASNASGLVTLTSGGLRLNKTGFNAIGANGLTITAGTATIFAANQIDDTATVTLNGGVLAVAADDTIGTVINNSGTVNGAGTLTTGTGGITFGNGAVVSTITALGGNVTYNGTTTGATFGAGAISLNGNRTFTVADGAAATDLTVSGIVSDGSGNRSITKDGAGTMLLSGANTFSGGVAINGGVVVANKLAVAGVSGSLGTGTVTVGTTGRLDSTVASALIGNSAITIDSGGELRGITTTGTLNTGTGVKIGLNGGIVRTQGAGTTSFGGNLNVTANSTVINERTGTASNTSMTQSLGTLDIGAFTLNAQSTDNQTGGTSGITFGATTLSGDAIFNVTNNNANTDTTNLTLGALGDGGVARTITKNGNGTLTLATAASGLTTGTAFTVNGGILTSSVAGALSNVATTPNTTSITVNSTGELRGTIASAFKSSGLGTPDQAISLIGGTLRLSNSAATNFGGNLDYTSGTVVLDRTSSGGTLTQTMGSLSIGAVTLAPTTNLYTTAPTLAFGSTAVTSDATLDASNVIFSLGTLGIGANTLTTSGTNTITAGATTLSGNATFDVGTTAPLALGAVGSGAFGITKTGSGTLTLSGAGTYTGATTVSVGTLALGHATGFNASSGVSLASDARLVVAVADANLSKVGSGVIAGSFLRYSANQSSAGSGNGPGTILGTVEVNAATVSPNYILNFGTDSKLTNIISGTYGGAITLSGNATFDAAVSALTVSGGVTSSTAGAKVLTLTGANTGNLTATNNPISGGSGTMSLVKDGAGTWSLTSSSTATSPTYAVTSATINQGTLRLDSQVGTLTGTVVNTTNLGQVSLGRTGVNSDNATLELRFTTNNDITTPLTVNAGSSGTLTLSKYTGSSMRDFKGGITLNNNLTIDGINSITTVGISGTGNITTKNTVGFNVANTFTGGVTVSSGLLSVASTNANVTGWTVSAGQINMTVASAWGMADMTFADTTKFGITNGLTASNKMTLSGTVTHAVGNGINSTLSGLITGSGALTYVGTNIEGLSTLSLSKTTGNDFSGGLTIKNTGTASANKNRGTLTVDAKEVNVLGSGVVTFVGDATGPTPSTPKYSVVTKLTASQTIAGLEGTPNSDHNFAVRGGNATVRTLTLNGATGTNTFGGIIGGTGTNENKIELTKSGGSTQTLTGVNTYTGATVVSGGKLVIGGAGSINGTSGVTVNSGGNFRYNSTVAYAAPITVAGGTVSGVGDINVDLGLNDINDKVSPGNSPGVQEYGVSQNWSAFTYDWEVKNFVGTTPGTDFDQILITGGLTLNSSNLYKINVLSLTAGDVGGDVPDFSEINRSWTVLSSTSALANFTAANWTVDVTGFTNPDAGSWTLGQTGNDLVLTYAAVPETNIAALVGGFGTLLLLRRRRR